MRLCASARFWRAIRIFFFRFASSILSFSERSEALSFSVSSRCFTHVSWSWTRSEEHTSELQSRGHLVCRLLLEKKKDTLLQNHPPGGTTSPAHNCLDDSARA